MSWLLIDKKSGPTSMAMTRTVKKLLGIRKAGHAGTLDPLASGVLPIALGQTTRLIPFMMEGVKKYIFTVKWGASTDTDDGLGKVLQTCDVMPSSQQILDALPAFRGDILLLKSREKLPTNGHAIISKAAS
jgi:tRNA pseudouridine55 synthase